MDQEYGRYLDAIGEPKRRERREFEVQERVSYNVQRETTFPQGMSRRQAAPALPPGAEA